MKLSLVVCTRDRASQLRNTLDGFASLRSNGSWELVVIDNGSTDGTQDVIEGFRAKFHQEFATEIEPVPGIGNARNRGWRIATGDLIIFTDDDCYPADDYLLAVEQCFAEDERLGFVGGRILLHDPTDHPITVQAGSERKLIEPGDFVPAGLIQGANLSCRRHALEAIDGFDAQFGVGARFACEDVDLLARISAQGWHGAYDPRPLVYHHHGQRTHAEAAQKMKRYDHGRGAYYAKCLVNPILRRTYAKQWCRSILRQSPLTTWREIMAGAEYLARAAFGRNL